MIVHFHDIFLPWEYPREWIVERNWFWNEQYLILAFMMCNKDFSVLFLNNHFLSTQGHRRRCRPDRDGHRAFKRRLVVDSQGAGLMARRRLALEPKAEDYIAPRSPRILRASAATAGFLELLAAARLR